jgi:pyridoxal biosynthesis lyase PdxS
MTHLIVMLTHNDTTVSNARAAYRSIRGCGLRYVGFKDIGLPLAELKLLTADLRQDGCQVMLEVVSSTPDAEMQSIEAAITLQVDYLLGGRHAKEAVKLLQGRGIRYYPFAGHTQGHPTQLTGDMQAIVEDAQALCALDGVHGLDLLAYRFAGHAPALARQVVKAVKKPVIAAGSINSPARVQAMQAAGMWAFTVGSALFEGSFDQRLASLCNHTLQAQVKAVMQLQGVTA